MHVNKIQQFEKFLFFSKNTETLKIKKVFSLRFVM